jgi:hypothetical protein
MMTEERRIEIAHINIAGNNKVVAMFWAQIEELKLLDILDKNCIIKGNNGARISKQIFFIAQRIQEISIRTKELEMSLK